MIPPPKHHLIEMNIQVGTCCPPQLKQLLQRIPWSMVQALIKDTIRGCCTHQWDACKSLLPCSAPVPSLWHWKWHVNGELPVSEAIERSRGQEHIFLPLSRQRLPYKVTKAISVAKLDLNLSWNGSRNQFSPRVPGTSSSMILYCILNESSAPVMWTLFNALFPSYSLWNLLGLRPLFSMCEILLWHFISVVL